MMKRLILSLIACSGLLACLAPVPASAATPDHQVIKHFIYLMQGGRSFDNYFGTYPGADGIPSGICQKLVVTRPELGCVKPYRIDAGSAPLDAGAGLTFKQMDGGRMDSFVAAFHQQGRDGSAVMGYYDRTQIPYYWDLASQYTLFDHFFSSSPLSERASRNFWMSGAAPLTDVNHHGLEPNQPTIFDELDRAGVSWKVYVENYNSKDNYHVDTVLDPSAQTLRVPLLGQARFVDDPRLNSHIVDLSDYYRDLNSGTLPDVAYVSSSGSSERSARSITAGQKLVRNMVTQLMLSTYWTSSAFLWSYDQSGGWFDHVAPPQGYGLRVPAVLVSPYARQGHVDPTVLDSTSALRFIEDNWHLPVLAARDKTAASIAGALNLGAGPRPPSIGGKKVAHGELTDSSAVYYTYFPAAALAVLLVVLAVALPRDRHFRPSSLKRLVPVGRKV